MNRRKIFLFDTNVYRRLVEIVNENRFSGNKFIIHAMCDREREKGCHSILSLTTSQELIAHLNKDDEVFEESLQALKFQIFHTLILQKPKIVPNIDSILSYFFYNTDSKDNRINYAEFVRLFLLKLFWLDKDIDTLKEDIDIINNDFLVYKNEFDLFFKEISIRSNNDDIDSYVETIKNYVIQRTKYFWNGDGDLEIEQNKILEFENYFKESLLHFRYLFESILKNTAGTYDFKNSHWNAIKDFHIVFEWCFVKYFNKGKEIDVILVTEDKSKNFKSPVENGEFKSMHDRNADVWCIRQYFEFLGFKVDYNNSKKLLRIELPNAEECDAKDDAQGTEAG